MVKKSSFLSKLVNRFRHNSGVRVDAGSRRRGRSETVEARAENTGSAGSVGSAGDRGSTGSGGSTGSLGEAGQVPVHSAAAGAEASSGRKISSREDAVIVMNESFGELASLLRGVHVRLEDQGGLMATMGEHTQTLPAIQQGMARAFTELPEIMAGVKTSLERVAAADKRNAETLAEFRRTMVGIQEGMGKMVESAKVQADAARVLAKDQKASAEKLIEGLNKERREQTELQKASVRQLEYSTQEGLRALRWAQEDQANRMVKLVTETSKWNRAILVLLIMSFAALSSIFVAILTG